ncbi:2-hydroxyacid dehydrogenase [Nocardioides marmoribigeumensis]|uniref:Glyoxylate reductase n=1 Tax=Nocardioides marmoribigeumensis TaxID=433649 RepID=A0ABU2BTB0_9ACTN|nr:NAD(P)-dependent oxidoreductase [Nocardioides marmoribigeumensis]MDR7360589.1 glyoxylate reductase [Nocardioides marmoribigeumensis]
MPPHARPVVLVTLPVGPGSGLPVDLTVDLPGCDVRVVGAAGLLEHPEAGEAVALVCNAQQRLTEHDLERLRSLKVVSVAGAGTDGMDLAALERHGVVLRNAPAPTAVATAELALALVLMAARQVDAAQAMVRAGKWTGLPFDEVSGRDLEGATLGLVGFGHIAQRLGAAARALGMRVRHTHRSSCDEPGHVEHLDDLLRASDVLSLHVPLTEETRGLVGPRELDLLPPGAIVVNTARGPVLDAEALCDRLDDGRLLAAGLDVYDDEPHVPARLLATPRLTLLPHLGSATPQTREAMARTAARHVAEELGGDRG